MVDVGRRGDRDPGLPRIPADGYRNVDTGHGEPPGPVKSLDCGFERRPALAVQAVIPLPEAVSPDHGNGPLAVASTAC